ncbi:MAG TPA: hypothetical protein VKB46_19745, partial [Pyrinomonadaceae bacterium]|nr:hypothetical protein [Pyrinomonadaceae bacterium]
MQSTKHKAPSTKHEAQSTNPQTPNPMLIDSHQHFWQVGRFDYPWMSPSLGVLYRDYLPEQLAPVLVENRVSKTVLVQASNSVAETRW